MCEKPCRLDRDVAFAGDLVTTDALLAAGHQVNCHQPLAERDLAVLKDRPDANRKLLAALLALVDAGPDG